MKNEHEQLQSFLTIESQELQNFTQHMDYTQLIAAKELIVHAQQQKNRVHVTGIGKPGHVAGYIASLLSSTGTPAYELHGTEAVHGSSGQVQEGDIVIAISNSGETEELKATIQTLKQNGAKIISVSGNQESWLAKAGDVSLFAGVTHEGDTLNKPPRSSILAEIIVLQCLSVLLQYEKNLDPTQYVKWHPGGSLGKGIKETMKEGKSI